MLEAMAAGVPVVQPRRGAFHEMIERTAGGMLVVPDRPGALGQQAVADIREHYSAARMAASAVEVYRAVAPLQEDRRDSIWRQS